MKTFTAKSMPEVLALVKQAYGSNGVILHTRSFKKGGVLGMGAKQMVEVTATDGRKLAQKYQRKTEQQTRSRASLESRPPLSRVMPPARQQPPEHPRDEPSAGDLIRKTYAAARADFGAPTPAASQRAHQPQQNGAAAPHRGGASVNHAGSSQGSVGHSASNHASATVQAAPAAPATTPSPAPSLAPSPAASAPVPVLTRSPAPDNNIADELTAMKQMMVKMMRQQKAASAATGKAKAAASTPELPDPLVGHYLKLIEQEVAEELAEEIVTKVCGVLTQAEFADPEKVRRAVHDEIAKRLPVEGGTGKLEPTTDGRPRTVALIGPTGVGKTTTIAKLAATFKLKQGKKVGLITMDTYRIAAVEQLRTYAGIIGLPLKVVNTAEQLTEAIKSYQHLDAILIDTAGRSQRATDKLGELKQVLAAADPHEVHLVLSSTVSQKVLLQTIDKFSAVDADRIIFTKLDEAVTGGVLLNVARRVGKKVSYITTGQEVPHEIEPGCSERLASLVMGESGE